MENFNLRKFLAEGRLFEDEILPDDPIANKDAEVGLTQALNILKQGASTIKPSPKDGELDESMTLGLIVGAPGLISLLGKGVNGISSLFQKDKKSGTVVGNALKKVGHKLEHTYIESLGGYLKIAFPKRYGQQDPHDESTELYKMAHGVYAAMLVAAALSSGAEALEAHNIIGKGLEGGLSAFKSAEVVMLANKISAAA